MESRSLCAGWHFSVNPKLLSPIAHHPRLPATVENEE
jgi:hypothetical protein